MLEGSKIQNNILIPAFVRLRQRIASNILKTGRNASGRTIKSLRVVPVNSFEVQLRGRFPFGTMETGRKGGKVPYHFVDIIKQWIEDKRIKVTPVPIVRKSKYTPYQRGLNALAGAIAYKIRKQGTQLHRAGGDDAIYSKEIPATIEEVGNDLRKSLFTIIKNEHIILAKDR